jgi:hypothetical protein
MKTLFIAFLISFSITSQSSAQGKRQNPPAKPQVIVQEDNPMTYYTKNYKYKTGQGYTRNTVRCFYGRRNNAADLFRKNDYKKGINVIEYNKYNKASFYSDRVFTMSEDKKEIAIELFRPILDSIFKQEGIATTLHAEIIVFGYTDETEVDKNSTSFIEIANKLQKPDMTVFEYNNAISFFRAKDVGDIISTLLTINSDKLNSYQEALVDVVIEGRGIEYPDYKRSYELEDDKRKIVKVYWHIFEN